MHFVMMIGVMLVLCVVWPNATRAIIIAPTIGIAVGGLTWSIVAISNKGFNSFESYLMFTIAAIVFAELWMFKDGLIKR